MKKSEIFYSPGLSGVILIVLFGVALSTDLGADPQTRKQSNTIRRPAASQVPSVKPAQAPPTRSISSSDFASVVATAFKNSYPQANSCGGADAPRSTLTSIPGVYQEKENNGCQWNRSSLLAGQIAAPGVEVSSLNAQQGGTV